MLSKGFVELYQGYFDLCIYRRKRHQSLIGNLPNCGMPDSLVSCNGSSTTTRGFEEATNLLYFEPLRQSPEFVCKGLVTLI